MTAQVLRPQESETIIIRATKSYFRPELTFLSPENYILEGLLFSCFKETKRSQRCKKMEKEERFSSYKKENPPLPLNAVRLSLLTSERAKHNYGFVTARYFISLALSSELCVAERCPADLLIGRAS